MKKMIKLTSVAAILALANTAQGQDTTPDDSIVFCDISVWDGSIAEHVVSPDGNLYVLPRVVEPNNTGFTAIKYYAGSQASEFDEYYPSVSTGGSVKSVAFAGNVLLHAVPGTPTNGFKTMHVTLYDYNQSTGDLTESQVIALPTTDNIFITHDPEIDAEPNQFVVENGNINLDPRVCVYRNDGTSWALDTNGTIDRSGNTRVTAVSIEGDTLVIGYSDEVVHLYTRDSVTGWAYEQEIFPEMNDVVTASDFGEAIEINGSKIAVGASRARVYDPVLMDDQRSGAVFVYDYTAGEVTHQETLFEHDGTDTGNTSRFFGEHLAFSANGELLMVGARQYDVVAGDYEFEGASFLYDTNDYSSFEEHYYDSDIDLTGATYGSSVQISGDLVSVFTHDYDSACGYKPAILLYETGVITSPCNAADLAKEYGQLNFADVSMFLQLYGQNDALADINNDGSWDFMDISGYLSIYRAGCP